MYKSFCVQGDMQSLSSVDSITRKQFFSCELCDKELLECLFAVV